MPPLTNTENMTLKKSADGKCGLEIEIWRFDATPGKDKGGIVVSISAPEIEQIVSDGMNQSNVEYCRDYDNAFLEAPPLYRAPRGHRWLDLALNYGNFVPDWKVSRHLINHLNGTYNLSFLRAVGLSDGVQFKIATPSRVDDQRTYLQALKQAVERIHDAYFKKYRVRLRVPAIDPAA